MMESIASTPRLENLLQNLEKARAVEDREVPEEFHGELRPYQGRGSSGAAGPAGPSYRSGRCTHSNRTRTE
mgnify:CR=1 FL=1